MPVQRAVNLFVHLLTDGADQDRLDEIDEALTPPLSVRGPDGRPLAWGDEDDAWSEFQANKT